VSDGAQPTSHRPLLRWAASLAGGAALLWLASLRVPLWPERIELPHAELLVVAIVLQVPYALCRAVRLRCLLDPLVARAAGPGRAVPAGVLFGSGLVSFFLVILLPLRLGELSRPILIARARVPGLGFSEVLGAVAVERVVDGLLVVGLLFGGLALAGSGVDGPPEALGYVRWFGRLMAAMFGSGLVLLLVAGRAPERTAAVAGRLGPLAASVVRRLTSSIAPLWDPRRGLPMLAWSILYWGITVAKVWLVLHACGLDLGPAQAAATVAIVGLSIQLPGGPAQAGSFQVGVALALSVFASADAAQGPGASFSAAMYLLQLGGAALLAVLGVWWLTRGRRDT
jgi:hypothetical protein